MGLMSLIWISFYHGMVLYRLNIVSTP